MNANLSPRIPGPGHPTNTVNPTFSSTQNAPLSSSASNQPTACNSSGRNPPITPYQSAQQPSSAPVVQSRLFPSAPISSAGVGSLYTNASDGLPANVPAPPQSHGSHNWVGHLFSGVSAENWPGKSSSPCCSSTKFTTQTSSPNTAQSPQCSIGSQLKQTH